MKEWLKSLLKHFELYHPLQSWYREILAKISRRFYRAMYVGYKGPGFTCNVCNRSYSRFVPHWPSSAVSDAIVNNQVIAGYGENVYCPYCRSTSRERLVIGVLHENLKTDHQQILHFAPEKHVFHYLKSRAAVTTVDAMPGFYRPIDPGIIFADATRLTFPDKSFDMVIANHIMEHIPQDRQAMSEIFRVLKKNGVAIMQVPYSVTLAGTVEQPSINEPRKQELLFGQRDHVRIYTLNDYITRLTEAGFSVKVFSPLQLSHLSKYAIQPGESFLLNHKF